MSKTNFSKACKEVLEILENVEQEDYNKIPIDFIENLKANADLQYESKVDLSKKFEEQELMDETVDLLAYIYRKYWCNQDEKAEFDYRIQKNEKIKINSTEDIFSKRKNTNKNIEKTISSNTEKNELTEIKKENFIVRLLNKIKRLFKK